MLIYVLDITYFIIMEWLSILVVVFLNSSNQKYKILYFIIGKTHQCEE